MVGKKGKEGSKEMSSYPKGYHPNTRKHWLTGTKPRYEEKKRPRTLMATDTGWENLKRIAKEKLGLSVSEMVDQIGRGQLNVSRN